MEKIIIMLDLDGPVADFNRAIGRVSSQDDDPDYTPPEMLEKGFFRDMPVTDGALKYVDLIMQLEHVELYIASKPTTKNLYCASEKYEWVNGHFPALLRRMFLTCDKSLLRGDILIDDYLKWGKSFRGEFLWFDNSNPLKSWENIYKTISAKNFTLELKIKQEESNG